ncbi:SDR family NAD(P)-dependent oxidoreductase [Rhodococcus sp. IEGM 1366]|uniref:SDR family NAD(P)-dependent oxidoreductase n=1 Tax=Rhodococcus sp. IEGM 1366 TaxID=3082223 RepID=UPI0029536CD6|nr:SDR family NAD(P)-dependent oxidoreductase [Rhodococcus sp. IEGM 1366]MDV8070667.1 SDR family NAD(P)-dependent oxidoreductase [Rhodococcus sp. IEGM 1366]
MAKIRFDNQVAVITGAGRGLGREYAIELARRGARVLVNDLGSALSGGHGSKDPANEVVEEIIAFGGEAVAEHSDVGEDAHAVAAEAIEKWGRVDILINNAGISGGGSVLGETPDEESDRVLDVNLRGSISMIKAVWPHMVGQQYGRIVNTTSGSVFGTKLTAPYVISRAAHIGMTTALATEGVGVGVKVNAVMPTAYTRMTDRIPSEEVRALLRDKFDPSTVAPMVVLLASSQAPSTGEFFHTGGGLVARVALAIGRGARAITSPEDALDQFAEISAIDGVSTPRSVDEYMAHVFGRVFDAAGVQSHGSLGV